MRCEYGPAVVGHDTPKPPHNLRIAACEIFHVSGRQTGAAAQELHFIADALSRRIQQRLETAIVSQLRFDRCEEIRKVWPSRSEWK